MVLGCSQLRTTFVLLCTVCLNLPATPFTPQGDHVIRSPPSTHLSSATPEKDSKVTTKEHSTKREMFTICWLGVCIFLVFFQSPT